MAKRKVTQDGAGETAEEAVELARRTGNVDVLRELDALARPLLEKMQADVDAQLRAMSRSALIEFLARCMELASDKIEASYAVGDILGRFTPPEWWPTTTLDERDAKGRFPPLLPHSEEQHRELKLLFLTWRSDARKAGSTISKKEEKRLDRLYFKTLLPPRATGKHMVATIARTRGLPEKYIDQLLALIRVPKSRRTKT